MSPLKMEVVHPYSRKGRAVSGYRRQRFRTMQLVSKSEVPVCHEPGCGAPFEELTIAHRTEDPFSSYAARSGGTNYAKWMSYVQRHPGNYEVLCGKHHGEKDCRVVPSPLVHRGGKRRPYLSLSQTERSYPDTSGLPRRAQRATAMRDVFPGRRKD